MRLQGIEFRLLGPVEVLRDGEPVALGAPKQRALLAELLLHRGVVLGRAHLVDALWGEAAPESAAASLQVYVHGLRRALGAERIETHGNGYRVVVEPDELDVARFESLLESGARALEEDPRPRPRTIFAAHWRYGVGRRSPGWTTSRSRAAPRRSTNAGSSRSSSATTPSCGWGDTMQCSSTSTS